MKFDLLDILKEIYRRRKFVLLFTLAAVAVSLLFCFLQKKEYTSEAIFIVKSPQIMDRNRVYHATNYDPTIFFATNDDVDNIVTIAKSDAVAQYIVEKYNLTQHYGFKTKDDAVQKFRKKMKFVRGDTKNIELYFTYSDPDTAFAVTKDITDKIEDIYRDYFFTINNDMVKILNAKVSSINDTLKILDDSISSIRQAYGLYNALPPARNKTVIQSEAGMNAGNADALEKLQQVTKMKDQYLDDAAEFTSLAQEYNSNIKDTKMAMLYRIQDAYLPDSPSAPNMPLLLLVALVAGFLFSSALVVIIAFYKKVAA